MTTDIPRVRDLTCERFVGEYLMPGRPVIVTDALDDWSLNERWSPQSLEQRFGQEMAQIYNDYFDLRSVRRLSDYLREFFNREAPPLGEVPYVRWYSKLRDVKFIWADQVFEQLRNDWTPPAFLPRSDYLLPFAPAPIVCDPTTDYFPARGLFISGRGAKTSLHADPWASDGVLCQLYGRKRWIMYSPEQSDALVVGGETVNLDRVDHDRFKSFGRAVPTYQFSLQPGETIYVPRGWFHHVETVTDAISLTWNFVHRSASSSFRRWLSAGNLSERDQSVLRFFYNRHLQGDASASSVLRLAESLP